MSLFMIGKNKDINYNIVNDIKSINNIKYSLIKNSILLLNNFDNKLIPDNIIEKLNKFEIKYSPFNNIFNLSCKIDNFSYPLFNNIIINGIFLNDKGKICINCFLYNSEHYNIKEGKELTIILTEEIINNINIDFIIFISKIISDAWDLLDIDKQRSEIKNIK